MELVKQMRDILSFVDSTEVLKAKLENFSDCIQSVLETIEDCSKSIYSYLNAGTIGKKILISCL